MKSSAIHPVYSVGPESTLGFTQNTCAGQMWACSYFLGY
jgi:hypothetical protein